MKEFRDNLSEFAHKIDREVKFLSQESIKKLDFSRIFSTFSVFDSITRTNIHVTLYRYHIQIFRTLYDAAEFVNIETEEQLNSAIIQRYHKQINIMLMQYREFLAEKARKAQLARMMFAGKRKADIEEDEDEQNRVLKSSKLVAAKSA